MAEKSPSIGDQAWFLEFMVWQSSSEDGALPEETWKRISKAELEYIQDISERLKRIAPFEGELRQMVADRARGRR